MIIEIPDMIADFLKIASLMVYTLFMMFITFYIGFYIYDFLESHIIGV